MSSMDPIVLGMKAAGMVFDIFSTYQQNEIIEAGRRVQQAAFETNMEALLTQNAEASFEEMKDLNANIGSQIANNAAKGRSSGGGTSASSGIQASITAFADDERARKINLLAQQASLTAGSSAAQIGAISSQTQLAQNLTKRIFNETSSKEVQKFFKGTAKSKSGFGLSKVDA